MISARDTLLTVDNMHAYAKGIKLIENSLRH
jgi:hypothetical protein